MKKLILTAAAAMMVLASCTKTKVESIDGPKEIAFKKIEGAMTKAGSELTTDMGVFAITHEATPKAYFSNIEFTKKTVNSIDVWGGSQYWPLVTPLDFVVYAPHVAGATYDITSTKLTYKITDNTAIPQTDYLYGKEYYNKLEGVGGAGYVKTDNNVAVVLKHALSKITVNIKAGIGGQFVVKTLNLNNTNQAGTINVTYPASDEQGDIECVVATGSEIKTKTFNIISSDLNLTTTDKNYTDMLVFPSDQTSFEITYTINGLQESQTIDLSAYDWEPGKHYIYNIVLTANEILFAPTVEEWATSGDNYVERPLGVN